MPLERNSPSLDHTFDACCKAAQYLPNPDLGSIFQRHVNLGVDEGIFHLVKNRAPGNYSNSPPQQARRIIERIPQTKKEKIWLSGDQVAREAYELVQPGCQRADAINTLSPLRPFPVHLW